MKDYTVNKPKALVPINNKPIIFHLFSKFPDKKYIVIGDYKKDVLESYLHTFAGVKHIVVDTEEKKGTCSGIASALNYIPDGERFMLIWSDLILSDEFSLPEGKENYIGISKDFSCRWSFQNNEFIKESSAVQGVAGLFVFKDKEILKNVPKEGEFVAWLKEQDISFSELPLRKSKEYGLYELVEQPQGGRCRAFNSLRVEGDKIIKEGIDEQGKELAKKEIAWYVKALEYKIEHIPEIYQTEPLVMEKIKGKNVFQYDFTEDEKREVLRNIVQGLCEIHQKETVPTDYFSMRKAYFNKTMERINKVRDLIPFANEQFITVNGRKCRNVLFYQREFERKVEQLSCDEFCFIHGDCTFSNIVIDEKLQAYFIDPRGYFGDTKLYGDPLYDWAKLYYSVVGNYDRFNLKQFTLRIHEGNVELKIESNGWEHMEKFFMELIQEENRFEDIKLIHALIWLSLTTYAWEDYDSICAAFYNGLFYLEECL